MTSKPSADSIAARIRRLSLARPMVVCASCGKTRPLAAHEWCGTCWMRWDRAGRPESGPPKPPEPDLSAGPVVRDPHPLVALLADLRIARGMSLYAAHKRTQLDTATVRRWETGEHGPTVYGLEKYADLFGFKLALVPTELDVARAEMLRRLEAERNAPPPEPPHWLPITPEVAAENRRVLCEALGFEDTYTPTREAS